MVAAAAIAARLGAAKAAADSVSWTPATIPTHVEQCVQAEIDEPTGSADPVVTGTAVHQVLNNASTVPSAEWLYCICLVPQCQQDPDVAGAESPFSCQVVLLEDCQEVELAPQQQTALTRVPWATFGLSLLDVSCSDADGAWLRFRPSDCSLPIAQVVCCKFTMLPQGSSTDPGGDDGDQSVRQRQPRARKVAAIGVKAESACIIHAMSMALQLLKQQMPAGWLCSRQELQLGACITSVARSMSNILSATSNHNVQQYACTLLDCTRDQLPATLTAKMQAAGAAALHRSLPAAAAAAAHSRVLSGVHGGGSLVLSLPAGSSYQQASGAGGDEVISAEVLGMATGAADTTDQHATAVARAGQWQGTGGNEVTAAELQAAQDGGGWQHLEVIPEAAGQEAAELEDMLLGSSAMMQDHHHHHHQQHVSLQPTPAIDMAFLAASSAVAVGATTPAAVGMQAAQHVLPAAAAAAAHGSWSFAAYERSRCQQVHALPQRRTLPALPGYCLDALPQAAARSALPGPSAAAELSGAPFAFEPSKIQMLLNDRSVPAAAGEGVHVGSTRSAGLAGSKRRSISGSAAALMF